MVGVPGKSKGCGSCRKRKIRCDLDRPTCARCIASKIQCEGYDRYPVFINRTASGIQKRPALEEVKNRTTLRRLSKGQETALFHSRLESLVLGNLETGWTQRERHSLDYFRYYSTSRLSGHCDQVRVSFCHLTSLLTSPKNFWRRVTLQLGHYDVAIRHLLVAIGAFHEEWEAKALARRSHSTNASRFALAQCNRAIGYLTNPSSSSRSTIVILTSSLLLAVIELLQDHYDSAYRCLKQGLRLRDEWWQRRDVSRIRDPQDNAIDTEIEPMFAYFSGRAEQARVMNSRPPLMSHNLENFTDAGEALKKIVQAILSSSEMCAIDGGIVDVDGYLIMISRKSQRDLEIWHTSFIALVGMHTTNMEVQCAITLLNIRYHMARIMAGTYPYRQQPLARTEAIFDAYLYDFNQIMQWSQTFPTSEKSHSDLSNSSTFGLNTSVAFALSFTASSCRNTEIRQQAMHVLRQNICNEGFCNNRFVAFVLEQVITIEEEKRATGSGFIEPRHRVRLLHLEYFPSQTHEPALLKLRILRTGLLSLETYETTETRSVPDDPAPTAATSHWTMEFGRAYATATAWEIQFA